MSQTSMKYVEYVEFFLIYSKFLWNIYLASAEHLFWLNSKHIIVWETLL